MPDKDLPSGTGADGKDDAIADKVEEGGSANNNDPAQASSFPEEKKKEEVLVEGPSKDGKGENQLPNASLPAERTKSSKDDAIKSRALMAELGRGGLMGSVERGVGSRNDVSDFDDEGDPLVVVEATRLLSQPNYVLPGAVRVSSDGGLEVLSASSSSFRANSSTFSMGAIDGGPVPGSSAAALECEIDLDELMALPAPPPLPPPTAAVSSTTVGSDYLVEADLVTDRDDSPHQDMVLVEAHPVKLMEDPRIKTKRLCLLLGAFVIVASVGIAVGVTLGTRGANDDAMSVAPTLSPTLYPTASPTYNLAVHFRSQLPASTVERINADSTSPQARAYRWVITSMTGDAMAYLGLQDITENEEFKVIQRCSQRMALATLFFATNNTPQELPATNGWLNQTGWLNKTLSECDWFGCTCRNNSDHEVEVVGLDLESNGLVGTIPPEIGLMLTSLDTVYMGDNMGLTGMIPSELGLLTRLEYLSFFYAQLTGPIPTELGILYRLRELDLSSNLLTGTIPSALSRTNLTDLILFANLLNGTVPTSLVALSHLSILDVSVNRLSGTVPTVLGLLTSLKELWLANNKLSGQVPTQLGQLTGLDNLHFFQNSITGPIPTELGNLARLQWLRIEQNSLNSTIPVEMGELRKLQYFRAFQNQLSGPIPTTLGLLTDLHECFLDTNSLTGTIPTELGRLSFLEELDVFGNQLQGSVPSSICTLIGAGLVCGIDCDSVQCSCGCTC